MKSFHSNALAVVLLFSAGSASAASYFVQPIVSVFPGETINGLEINGATSRSEGFNNAPTSVNSEINLDAGTIRGNVDFGTATGLGGLSQGRFGEEVTFVNGDGTEWNFNFSFGGDVFADARDPNLNSRLQFSVEGYIAVFAASNGADSGTWFDRSFGGDPGDQDDESLFKDRIFLDFSDPTDDLDEFVSGNLGGSLPIGPGQQSFDIFANLSLIVVKNNNPGEARLDFRNTASFSIEVDPGVTYTSASGTFLASTGVTPIPVPAALPLMLTALSGLGWCRVRKSRILTVT